MAAVTIKGREEKIQVNIAKSDDFNHVIAELQEKLIFMQRLSQSTTWEAFFSIPENLSDEELYRVFSEVEQHGGTIIGFVSTPKIQDSTYSVYPKDIRSGEHIDFSSATIVFGDIHANAFVECEGDLFVMGSIHGNVRLLSKNASLYAMQCFGANLQIFDEFRLDFTSFTPVHLYDGVEVRE